MSQATDTIYGDVISSETVNEMKLARSKTEYAMDHLTDLSKLATKGVAVIHVPFINVEDAQEIDINAAFEEPGEVTSGSNDLPIDRSAGNPFNIDKKLDYQTAVKTLKIKSATAAKNILMKMDVAILIGVIGAVPAAAIVDFDTHATKPNILSKKDIINAVAFLNENEVPLEDRFCFIGPKHHAQLLDIEDFISVDKIGVRPDMPMKKGFLGHIAGIDFYSINHLPKVDKAGAVNATALKNDSTPIIFGHPLAYVWAKQLVSTDSGLSPLSGKVLHVPSNTYGHKKLINEYLYQISDKTTADPTS